MYNTDLPRRADLPTSAQLRRSTIIAAFIAAVILVTIVLPAEYAIDPTRAGRLLGLTEMGEIKTQLAAEAEADATAPPDGSEPAAQQISALEQRMAKLERRFADKEFIARIAGEQSTAGGQETQDVAPAEAEPSAAATQPVVEAVETGPEIRNDEISITLAPGQGTEIKLVMEAGKRAQFWWTANGSVLNYDTHGDGGGRQVSYEKGRGVAGDEGVLEAAFDGNHGWFWRNRTKSDVTLTLKTSGDYQAFKRLP